MTPASLAARCGYADCALYLQRAAEQQQLKRSGIIDDVVLPIVPRQLVLPGQKPDRCVITQVMMSALILMFCAIFARL